MFPDSTKGSPVCRAIELLSRHFVLIVTLISLLSYAFVYFEGCFGEPIRADGVGYYAYLPAYAIHRDVSFQELAEDRYGGKLERWTGLALNNVTGRYANKYGIGVAIMMLPFFAAADLITWIMQSPPGAPEWFRFNHPMDGYSLFYQHAAGLSGMVYMILGLVFLRAFLRRRFSESVTMATMFALLLGTNLLHYGCGESVLSHPYSFFLFSAFLLLVEFPDLRNWQWRLWRC
jgi:hypothetical protein